MCVWLTVWMFTETVSWFKDTRLVLSNWACNAAIIRLDSSRSKPLKPLPISSEVVQLNEGYHRRIQETVLLGVPMRF
jgi:hypothetical protein